MAMQRKMIILAGIQFLLYTTVLAQVAINNDNSNPDNSAMLDVKSSTRGFLPPRVSLVSVNSPLPITSPATGLLVYNIATSGSPPYNVAPGHYYWNGARWILVEVPQGSEIGDMLYWNGTQWVRIPVGTNGQILTLNSGIPSWVQSFYQVPSLITDTIASVTAISAVCGGNVSDGGKPVTSRGVCWNTTPNATISNNKTTNGSGAGTYTSTLTGLSANTLYYVRSYATNSVGTGYGNEWSFQTQSGTISLTTASITNNSGISATSGGTITNDGGASVIERGVCWSTNPDPTILNNHTTDGSGMGSFVSSLSGLAPNTQYYVRAYATNCVGTTYGNELIFITPSIVIGQQLNGGILFYIDNTGQHGLIANAFDINIMTWGCWGTLIGGTATGIGTGQANTTAILNGCSTIPTAAWICEDWVYEGYDDWFLPSKDELYQLYLQRNIVGGFTNNSYWTSSECSNNHAWKQNFLDGTQSCYTKEYLGYVRPIRAF